MKRSLFLICFLIVGFSGYAQKLYKLSEIPNPKKQGENFYVSNPDGILQNTVSLNNKLSHLEKQTGVEFAIVAVNDFDADADEFNFALNIFRNWGIGKKDKNNGLLLFVAVNRKKYRFITGYGLEGELSDGNLKTIAQNNLVPYFKQKDYAGGIENVTKAIINKLTKQQISDDQASKSPTLTENNGVMGETIPGPSASTVEGTYQSNHLLQEVNVQQNKNRNYIQSAFYKFKNSKLILISSILSLIGLSIFSAINILKHARSTNNLQNQSRIKLGKKFVSSGFLVFVVFIALHFFFFSGSDSFFSSNNLFKIFFVIYVLMAITLYITYTKARVTLSNNFFDDENYNDELILLNKKFWWFFVLNPVLLIIRFKQLRKDKLLNERFTPIMDSKNNLMERLDRDTNIDGEPFINRGKHTEEKLGVNDYDIWQSADKKEYKVIIWPEDNYADYDVCPKCSFKTLSKPEVITIKQATYTHTGMAKQVLECRNCKFEKLIKNIVIPVKVESSSSSSGSSSSSSRSSSSSSSSRSSSFGGGSSGGGGAGGSW